VHPTQCGPDHHEYRRAGVDRLEHPNLEVGARSDGVDVVEDAVAPVAVLETVVQAAGRVRHVLVAIADEDVSRHGALPRVSLR
jgi:hypothetical protein